MPYLHVYRAPSGQWSGKVLEEVAGLAGHAYPVEVVIAARGQFPGIVDLPKDAPDPEGSRPVLEIVDEDAGLFAIAREAGETLGVIGPMDDRDAIMAAVIARWPTIEHIDLDDD